MLAQEGNTSGPLNRAGTIAGRSQGLLGEYQRAIEDYDKAIQLDPDDAMAYNNRGVAYYYLGQYTKQAADRAKACSLDSQFC